MTSPTRATLTIKSRPRAGGSVSWFLWIRRPRPERDELIPAKGFSKLSDRPAVEAFAAPYRKALRKGLSEPQPETLDEWHERFVKQQREAGRTDPTNATRWAKWISPRIGKKRPDAVTRNDVEDIRDALDTSVRAWLTEGKGGDRISGKTSMNVWSCLTSAFKAATSSKSRALRVLDGKLNPCIGVEPPGDRDSRKSRRKLFIYPKECAAVLACRAVPLEWREAHALAAYTYLRPGELRVLTWADVDIEAGRIHVTRAWDYNAEETKAPKTRNGVRHVPIEPALVPLLERMKKGKATSALVVPALEAFGEDHLAELFREHLQTAGVDRAELHASTRTHVQANFRSWRDSGITWLAIAGTGVDKIMRRAGHDVMQTTMGYVKLAEDLSGNLGQPFGGLPASLIKPDDALCEQPVNREPSDPLQTRKGSAFWPSLEREKGFETDAKPGFSEGSANPCEPSQREKPSADDEQREGSLAPVEPMSDLDQYVARTCGAEVERATRPQRSDPDEALRQAIVAALYAGDLPRVKALVAILESSSSRGGRIVDMDTARAKRR